MNGPEGDATSYRRTRKKRIAHFPIFKKSHHVASIKNLPYWVTEDIVLKFLKISRREILAVEIPLQCKAKSNAKRPVRAIIAFPNQEMLENCIARTHSVFCGREIVVEKHEIGSMPTECEIRPTSDSEDSSEGFITPGKQKWGYPINYGLNPENTDLSIILDYSLEKTNKCVGGAAKLNLARSGAEGLYSPYGPLGSYGPLCSHGPQESCDRMDLETAPYGADNIDFYECLDESRDRAEYYSCIHAPICAGICGEHEAQLVRQQLAFADPPMPPCAPPPPPFAQRLMGSGSYFTERDRLHKEARCYCYSSSSSPPASVPTFHRRHNYAETLGTGVSAFSNAHSDYRRDVCCYPAGLPGPTPTSPRGNFHHFPNYTGTHGAGGGVFSNTDQGETFEYCTKYHDKCHRALHSIAVSNQN